MSVRLALLGLFMQGSSALAAVTTGNVGQLVHKWDYPSPAGVTGDLVLDAGCLYVAPFSGRVACLDPVRGVERWAYAGAGPVAGGVELTDDGGLCFGTLTGNVVCLDAADGSERWKTNLADTLGGAVWSAVASANGRLFVGVASLSDQPCTRGRLVALDLATGAEVWRLYTVPEKVCTTDTGVECAVDGDCPAAGTCVLGRGAGVTATVAIDPTGEVIHMNTVGCYTFPSIGDSDSMFRISAATGVVSPGWPVRVNAPEQFGLCQNDGAIDCGTDADCSGVGGVCTTKPAYHDFGFLNGPLRVAVPDGPGTKTIIVSGSKNGTLYAFDEDTGATVWTNEVRPTPVSPGFGGFGLFNGSLAHDGGRIYAALYELVPARTCSNAPRGCGRDEDCPGGTCLPEPKHLMAFDAATGTAVWETEIGDSWSHVHVQDGIVYAGTQVRAADDSSHVFAHDAATGVRLATFPVPATSVARAAVSADSVFFGFGISGAGGVRAYSLCGNGTVDSGEQCDDGNGADGDCCTAECQTPATCDDGDACTSGDTCGAGVCAGTITTLEQLDCSLDGLAAASCGDETLPAGLARVFTRSVARLQKLADKARETAQQGKTAKVAKLRRAMLKALDGVAKKIAKAAQSKRAGRAITEGCRTTLDAVVTARRGLLENFVF